MKALISFLLFITLISCSVNQNKLNEIGLEVDRAVVAYRTINGTYPLQIEQVEDNLNSNIIPLSFKLSKLNYSTTDKQQSYSMLFDSGISFYKWTSKIKRWEDVSIND